MKSKNKKPLKSPLKSRANQEKTGAGITIIAVGTDERPATKQDALNFKLLLDQTDIDPNLTIISHHFVTSLYLPSPSANIKDVVKLGSDERPVTEAEMQEFQLQLAATKAQEKEPKILVTHLPVGILYIGMQ